jgi:hypothetical protein
VRQGELEDHSAAGAASVIACLLKQELRNPTIHIAQ